MENKSIVLGMGVGSLLAVIVTGLLGVSPMTSVGILIFSAGYSAIFTKLLENIKIGMSKLQIAYYVLAFISVTFLGISFHLQNIVPGIACAITVCALFICRFFAKKHNN